jgi:hypothetical protein
MSPDALVIRFRPTDPDRVAILAEKEHRVTGRYGLSVFADTARSGEDTGALIDRLLAAAELDGIATDKNPKFYLCSAASELLSLPVRFYKYTNDDTEVAEHYSADLGGPEPDRVVRFLDPFGEMKR